MSRYITEADRQLGNRLVQTAVAASLDVPAGRRVQSAKYRRSVVQSFRNLRSAGSSRELRGRLADWLRGQGKF